MLEVRDIPRSRWHGVLEIQWPTSINFRSCFGCGLPKFFLKISNGYLRILHVRDAASCAPPKKIIIKKKRNEGKSCKIFLPQLFSYVAVEWRFTWMGKENKIKYSKFILSNIPSTLITYLAHVCKSAAWDKTPQPERNTLKCKREPYTYRQSGE